MSQGKIIGATPRVVSALQRMISTPRNMMPPEAKRTISQTPATAQAGYSGPFAVVQSTSDDGDEILKLLGYNSEEKRYFHNYIDIGLESRLEVEEQVIGLSMEGWIYLKITYDSAFKVELKKGEDFPVQTNTELYIRIAYVKIKDDKIESITQYQYGGINLFGRVI